MHCTWLPRSATRPIRPGRCWLCRCSGPAADDAARRGARRARRRRAARRRCARLSRAPRATQWHCACSSRGRSRRPTVGSSGCAHTASMRRRCRCWRSTPWPTQARCTAAWRDLKRYALAMFVSPNAVSHFFAARPVTCHRIGLASGNPRRGHRAWHPAGPAAAPACRRRCASHRRPTPRSSTPRRCGRDCAARPGPVATCWCCAAMAAATSSQRTCDKPAPSVHFIQAYRRGPRGSGCRRTSPARRRAGPAGSGTSGGCRAPRRWATCRSSHLAPTGARRRRWPRTHALRRERVSIGFGHVFEAPPTLDAVRDSLLRIEGCLQSSPP